MYNNHSHEGLGLQHHLQTGLSNTSYSPGRWKDISGLFENNNSKCQLKRKNQLIDKILIL